MPGIVETCAIVRDTEFLDAAHGTRIFDCDGCIIGKRLQQNLVLRIHREVNVDQLNDPQNSAAGHYWDAHYGTASFKPLSAALRINPRLNVDILDDQQLGVL